jgi:hypothetical protein
MEVVDRLHAGYGESPNQGQIQGRGNEYLDESFPELDRVIRATIE